MENAQSKRKLLKQIMTAKPMTKEEHDQIQRRKVEHRRFLEDVAVSKKLQST